MERENVPSTTQTTVDAFLEIQRIVSAYGFSHQLIEDERFSGDTIRIHGREVCNFGLCSYLGLGDDPRLVEAAIDAVRRYGNSYSSSLAYTGLPLYGDLRQRLSHMLDVPVLVAASTSLAHMAALPVLIAPDDLVLVDVLAHASLNAVLPSLRDKGTRVRRVPHNDLDRVSDLVSSHGGTTWLIIDGLYSMRGDTAPAEGVIDLLDAHESLWVYCDDAHGFGWSGEKGRGQFLERAGWHDRLVMSFGLAKSFGSMGGVVATPDEGLVERIEIMGGPMVFGGPLPPAVLAASIASADIHLSPELIDLQQDLVSRIRFVNDHAAKIGLPLANTELTPLWFVEIGASLAVLTAVARLFRDGYFVNGAVYPVVQKGKAGIRFTVTRYNTFDQITAMLEALHQAWLDYAGAEDVIDLAVLEGLEPGSTRPDIPK